MTLHATFRGGPADGTDRTYPHISNALPALWWSPDPIPITRPVDGHPRTEVPRPRTAERTGSLAGHNDATALIDLNDGAAYRLCCPDPSRDCVWIYVVIDPPPGTYSSHTG